MCTCEHCRRVFQKKYWAKEICMYYVASRDVTQPLAFETVVGAHNIAEIVSSYNSSTLGCVKQLKRVSSFVLRDWKKEIFRFS